MRFQIKPSANGQWYFVIRSGVNILATSETYTAKSSARRTAQKIIDEARWGSIDE
ncbi:YegP family protein [Allokutzneria sp. A3M-2-11 16]|uniref:DUF1508 domain-containing protein n=1 Tax=Allokutzneria sp. A3M-2-11 16 TaxID=2962043 RepID=UPI0020B71DB8|nr:DUF1508 domain-containing protein [Allokutzneria sp. A3M-2-11 16]MCP3801061.1 YegP family protein [Allokutzneria sp. A3M-2-11 16]